MSLRLITPESWTGYASLPDFDSIVPPGVRSLSQTVLQRARDVLLFSSDEWFELVAMLVPNALSMFGSTSAT